MPKIERISIPAGLALETGDTAEIDYYLEFLSFAAEIMDTGEYDITPDELASGADRYQLQVHENGTGILRILRLDQDKKEQLMREIKLPDEVKRCVVASSPGEYRARVFEIIMYQED